MPKPKTVKRTFRFHVKVEGATKEFKAGMGLGVVGFIDYTFNLQPEQYKSTTFALALLDYSKKAMEEFIKVECEEVK